LNCDKQKQAAPAFLTVQPTRFETLRAEPTKIFFMTEYVVKTGKSKDFIDEYAKHYNNINAHKFKKNKDGSPSQSDSQRIKDGHTNLLVALVNCLAAQLHKLLDAGLPVNSKNALTLNHFHSYYTHISKGRLNKDKRTIRRYLDHLADCGLILFTQVDGRSLITIHPDLIRFTDKFEVLITCSLCQFFSLEPGSLRKIQNPDIQPLFLSKGVNLSPKPITGNSIKPLDSVADKPHHENTAQGETVPVLNTTQSQPEQIDLEARKACEKNGEIQAPRPKNYSEFSALLRQLQQNKQAETRASMVNRLVVFLWSFAIRNFYETVWNVDKSTGEIRSPYPHFAESQETLVLNFYHDQFTTVPDHRLDEVYQQLHERNKRWLKFLKKDPENRFTPLPKKFYDLLNQHGYQRTKSWIAQDKKTVKNYSAKNEIDYQLRQAKRMLTGVQTYKGKHLTNAERQYYLDQINAHVEQIANKYDQQNLKLNYQRRLHEWIEKNPTIISGIN
jgi:ankyrin repeat protein